MSTRNRLLIAVSALAFISAVAVAADGPNLGRVATPEEMAAWDVSIGPDGVGVRHLALARAWTDKRTGMSAFGGRADVTSECRYVAF